MKDTLMEGILLLWLTILIVTFVHREWYILSALDNQALQLDKCQKKVIIHDKT